MSFINKFTPLKDYIRHSSVYFDKENIFVPYPIQNSLRFLDKETIKKILEEISSPASDDSSTMEGWLLKNFGSTLCKLFFYPFHELYTANLYKKIAPQDIHKSPVDIKLVKQGAMADTPSAGYNATFVYPKEGLDTLIRCMAKECDIHYEKRATKINAKEKKVHFADGSVVSYDRLVSTLPLNKMIEMTGLRVDQAADPYTSVLVLNIGAERGNNCPDEHWLYNPRSKSGFHRVGFYSNVDTSFLPKASQEANGHVSIYVERAYLPGQKPSEEEIKTYIGSVVNELQELNFIKNAEVVDPVWVEAAYTWSWPDSKWKEKAIALLKEHNIYQIGRYGRWKFQGIAESIREGLSIKRA